MSLRTWLIKKLGGYPKIEHSNYKIVHTEVPITKLSVDILLDSWALHQVNTFDLNTYIKNAIAEKLAKKMIKENLVTIYIKDDDPLQRYYRATVYIAKEPT